MLNNVWLNKVSFNIGYVLSFELSFIAISSESDDIKHYLITTKAFLKLQIIIITRVA